jgi:hypothetical protein
MASHILIKLGYLLKYMKQGETKLYVDIEEGKCFNAEDMNKDRQR